MKRANILIEKNLINDINDIFKLEIKKLSNIL